ncbi:MAG: glycerol-3-phosphate 1-O-acyltransferase PlsY [Deltaproteobacteria bacterium]|nr:glycerol-3-phosphate 1-O-acyltransferase PlsY [Deltaproteobacteria bacterium]
MSPTHTLVLLVATAYLVGSVPFGFLLARRFAHVDVRAAGSGNIGATNVARSAGKGLGLLTLLLDALKGAVVVAVAQGVLQAPLPVVAASGFAAVFGHSFSIFMRFRGGKGVATALGVLLAIAPLTVAFAAPAFGVAFLLTRFVSLGSLVAAGAAVAGAATVDRRVPVVWLTAALLALILWRHRSNIGRLLHRREPTT